MESSKVKQELFDVNNENLQKLASLFPSAVKDGQLDIDALKEELGQFEEVGQEKYELTWAGKQNAKKEARRNVLGKTLRYIEGDGVDEDTTQNLYIEGDNLEVLKLLRKNYYGKIKMIYIDPPYNTGSDFVYKDNFSMTQEELEQMQGERDEYGEKLQKNSKDTAKYHTNWLNMMYPRLQLAKDLLTEDGVIFISIDEHEDGNIKGICNEIYGENNFIGCLTWEATTQPINAGDARFSLQQKTESIFVFAKNKSLIKGFKLEESGNTLSYPHQGKYGQCRFEIIEKSDSGSYSRETMKFKILGQFPREGKRWQIGEKTARELEKLGKVEIIDGIVKKAIYPEDEIDRIQYKPFWSLLLASNVGTAQNGKDYLNTLMQRNIGFDTVKPIELIQELIKHFDDNITILDFFAGTSTTADAMMRINTQGGNRKFILVQIPEILSDNVKEQKDIYEFLKSIGKQTVLTELGKERIRRAGKKIKEEIEAENQQLQHREEPKKVPDIGFKVFRVGETTLNWEKLNLQGKDIYHDYIAGTSEKDKLDFTPDFKNDLNVVYEIMLRQEGLPLTSKIEKLTDIGSRTYLVADSYLISLEEDITPEMVEKLSTLNPLPIKFVFRDSAFDDNIVFKDETFRRLNALIDKNTSDEKKTYTVEFI